MRDCGDAESERTTMADGSGSWAQRPHSHSQSQSQSSVSVTQPAQLFHGVVVTRRHCRPRLAALLDSLHFCRESAPQRSLSASEWLQGKSILLLFALGRLISFTIPSGCRNYATRGNRAVGRLFQSSSIRSAACQLINPERFNRASVKQCGCTCMQISARTDHWLCCDLQYESNALASQAGRRCANLAAVSRYSSSLMSNTRLTRGVEAALLSSPLLSVPRCCCRLLLLHPVRRRLHSSLSCDPSVVVVPAAVLLEAHCRIAQLCLLSPLLQLRPVSGLLLLPRSLALLGRLPLALQPVTLVCRVRAPR